MMSFAMADCYFGSKQWKWLSSAF